MRDPRQIIAGVLYFGEELDQYREDQADEILAALAEAGYRIVKADACHDVGQRQR